MLLVSGKDGLCDTIRLREVCVARVGCGEPPLLVGQDGNQRSDANKKKMIATYSNKTQCLTVLSGRFACF